MLQQEEPGDYVMATGVMRSVEDFCSLAFAAGGMPLKFRGEGVERKGYDERGAVRVEVDPRYFRPTEVELLQGDASKAKERLGWEAKVGLDELVRRMVEHDVGLAKRLELAGG